MPPNNEVVFTATIDLKYNPGEYEGFVKPNNAFSQKIGLLVGRVLANASKLQTSVRLLNPSTSGIHSSLALGGGEENVWRVHANLGVWGRKIFEF